MKNELIVIGGGSGQPQYILPVAKEIIEESDYVISSKRFLEMLEIKNGIEMKNIPELIERIPEYLKRGQISVIVSGDPLMYSFCRTILNKYPEIPVKIIAGVGALQLLGCAFGITMEESAIMSLHGRECTSGKIAYKVSQNKTTFFYCSKSNGIREIATALLEYNLKHTEIFVGVSLTYPEQELFSGTPEEIVKRENPELCVAVVKNLKLEPIAYRPLLRDSDFIRSEVPMTKEEIRAIIINKLNLQPDFTVWDIGAGTGSISVECARMCPYGKVYSVEYKQSALDILYKNKEYFGLENMEIISGRALEQIDELPLPDCIFIGGSDGELKELADKISKLPKKVNVAVSAVTYETQSEGYRLFSDNPEFDVIQISVNHSRKIGRYRIADKGTAVTLFTFIGGCGK